MSEAGPDDTGAGERIRGEVTLADRTWTCEAAPVPADENGAAGPAPFLRWYEMTFRRTDDPDQEAVARAGIPAGDWSEETLRSVLRSARSRTWRGPDGRLWTVRLEGWSAAGISTEVDEPDEGKRSVLFVRETAGGKSREIRRTATGVASITAAEDAELAELLESG